MIQVGHVLDKYELLERVGQGGMAVVYRGLDRTLKRTVAVKVLHKHLADYQEARDRFEREAQAVAKLRHENILEIFDYAARADEEAYIVTEFIDGQTLKQFITDRPIAFPELGAMIMLQVCRALAHAHAGGILHRDVKPENIMIRSDGVVKLMDFGISHMVDLERLTVTGQLLGSPAYMAPEHVEGRPLDFRTDVFAAGIVLYQLTTGKLPFEGKNPHEVLKRIAECKFVDPRQVNPRIGNRLGRIILRAMAAQPKDRYAAIGEMVIALERYLEESGLAADKVTSELARYFQAPVAYESALGVRLVDHLTRRGQELLAGGEQAAALDMFDRVLTIEPENAKVLSLLERINRRARLRQVALVALAAVALGGGGYLIHLRTRPAPPVAPVVDPPLAHDDLELGPHVETAHVAALPDAGAAADGPPDAAAVAAVHVVRPSVGPTHVRDGGIDAGPAAQPPVDYEITVNIAAGNEWRVDKGPWHPFTGRTFHVQVDHTAFVEVRNPCCQLEGQTLERGKPPAAISLQFRPARLKLTCDVANASAQIAWDADGKRGASWTPGTDLFIPFERDAMSSTKSVEVTFSDGRKLERHDITVTAGKLSEAACTLR